MLLNETIHLNMCRSTHHLLDKELTLKIPKKFTKLSDNIKMNKPVKKFEKEGASAMA